MTPDPDLQTADRKAPGATGHAIGPISQSAAPSLPWRKALKYRLEYAGFLLGAALLGALGMDRASAFSGWLWRTIAPRLKRHPRALANLARAFPEKTEAEREAIALAMWDNMGRTFGEAFHLEEIAASGRVIYENPEVVADWLAREGGKVACSAHLGNWELAILNATRSGLRPWSIYQRIKNPFVEKRVQQMRQFLYTGGLVPKNPSLPRVFMRVLKEGGTIGFLADLRDSGGLPVPFFGSPAPSTTFPALLARTVGCPVLLARMRRLDGVRFVQTFELIETPTTDDRKADIAALTATIQARFEHYIRQAPDQWMWAHRRWG